MEFAQWHESRLSKLMLGTVQFGLPYGVANPSGQPEYNDVVEIVAAALDAGVNCFDTAAAYGESERILGRVLRQLDAAARCVVVTKIRPVPDEAFGDLKLARRTIESSIQESRKHLGLDRLPLVLFHRERDIQFLDLALELVDRGWIERVGVSCGNEVGLAGQLLTDQNVAALQLPSNLVDSRHRDSGVIGLAPATNTAVFIRSVFLQGLLLMDEAEIPSHLVDVIPARRQFAEIAEQSGVSLGELAIRHTLGIEGVTCVLVGVDSRRQMLANLDMFHRGSLPGDVQAAVDEIRPCLPERVLTPGLWPG
jgi:aryl-alcohol dehydrogenase-like predicted oxidoreductase